MHKVTFTCTYPVHAPRHTHMPPNVCICTARRYLHYVCTYTAHNAIEVHSYSTHTLYIYQAHLHARTVPSVLTHTAHMHSHEYLVMCACTTNHQTLFPGHCVSPPTPCLHTYTKHWGSLWDLGYGGPNAWVKRWPATWCWSDTEKQSIISSSNLIFRNVKWKRQIEVTFLQKFNIHCEFYFVTVLASYVSTWHKLQSSERMKPQLRKRL